MTRPGTDQDYPLGITRSGLNWRQIASTAADLSVSAGRASAENATDDERGEAEWHVSNLLETLSDSKETK